MLHRNFILSAALLCGLSACGPEAPPTATATAPVMPIPPTYGLYAFDGDHLVRLDGDANWERASWSSRSDLPPQTAFMIYAPSLASDSRPLQDLVQLRRVAHVRNDVEAGGQVMPAQANRWAAPDFPDYRVALDFAPVAGRPDVVMATPTDPLPDGLYSFGLRSQPQPIDARLGIRWSDVNQAEYAEAHCVDSYPDGYHLCMESDVRANDPAAGVPTPSAGAIGAAPAPVATAPLPPAPEALSDALMVRNLHSERVVVAGAETLVVEADIVNASENIQTIPSSVQLSLLGADGSVVERVPVGALPAAMLAPGDSYHLRTEVNDPPADAVGVRLAPAG